MKNTAKRILSTVLVVLMVVTMLPTFAAAEVAADDIINVTNDPWAIEDWYIETNVNIKLRVNSEVIASGSYPIAGGLNNTLKIELAGDGLEAFNIHDVSDEKALHYSTYISDDGKSVEFTYYTISGNSVVYVDLDHVECVLEEVGRDEPTCEQAGVSHEKCKFCEETNDVAIPALGHDIQRTEDYKLADSSVAPTCTEGGKNVYGCKRADCTYTEEEAVEALEHDWNVWNYVADSDKGEGKESQHTRSCKREGSHTETEACFFEVDESKHVDPTETAPGSNTYVCKYCQHSYTVEIPATAKKYTVSYDANGGKGSPEAEEVFEQKGYSLNSTVPSHDDVDGVKVAFLGWTLAKNENIIDRNDVSPVTVTTIDVDGNKTVYAAWAYDRNNNGKPDVTEKGFELTYDVNGGDAASAPVDTNRYFKGETANITSNKPTHQNVNDTKVVFAGWTAAPLTDILGKDDAAPAYVPATVTFGEENVTVYAAWGYDANGDGEADVNQSKYTLTYDANGGHNAPAAVSGIVSGTEIKVSDSVKPTHDKAEDGTAIVFIGWTAAADNKIYAKGDKLPANLLTSVKVEADTTVFAVYGLDKDGNGAADVSETYATLTYDANGGKDAPASETKALDKNGQAKFSVPKTEPTRAEYTFKGWATEKDGKVVSKPGDTVVLSGNATLYAVWELNPEVTYTLKFDPYGGKNAPKAVSVTTRLGYADIVVPKDTPTRDGCVFIGWNTTGKGRVEVKPGDTVRISEDVTLYALWLSKDAAPKTGDESNLALWASLLAISAIGAGAVLTISKKRRQN